MDAIRKRLLEHQLKETLCVDEQIIPFTGRLGMKQYIRGKPCPWGIKLYVLCGKSGMPYDFIAYQGSSTEIEPSLINKLGFGASITLQLLKRVPQDSAGHQVYTDNFFTTYSLLEIFEKRKILAAGTIRINRFRNPPLSTDAVMRKKGRGCAEQVASRDGKVIVTKWFDNKGVYLASNFVGIGIKDKVERYEKKEKRYIEIDRPEVVQLYNNGMGGVDLLDQMLQHYRIFIKSKKWTPRVIIHFFDMAIVASWFEYKADADKNDIPKKDQMDLLAFRKGLANTLATISSTFQNENRRGRSSNTFSEDEQQAPKRLKYFNQPPTT
ncbi:piggyBac transposable element-derived protein 3-like [Rhagoletis pomonella]|uniref:piggyBac transposable element-derived protein 3-like n=1 Tax=Rhagoletis pomonella TaxID=28610 RepID=UPI001786BBE8|nr:piggyBac transposable element-derived protein 3-like [Rhagoletis pomonella]